MHYTAELYHHGIKGMKWGVRRFQNQNGTLTNAGKRRYGSNEKSKHRLKLEEKYRKKGMSQKQAEMAAQRRIKTEAIITATAALTLTAAAAYAANKYVKNNVDRMIKYGSTLQRVEYSDTGELHDVFFAAKNKADRTRYTGLLGMDRYRQTGHAYKMDLSTNNDIKIAAKKNAKKVFKELYDKDSDFRKQINELANTNIHGTNGIKITGKMEGEELSKVYDNFNSHLVNLRDSNLASKFYGALKDKGYGAIQDINDMKFSGYNASDPLIVFADKGKVVVDRMKEIPYKEISDKYYKVKDRETIKKIVKQYVGLVPAAAFVSGTSRAANTQVINEYRLEHPNTNLTDKEILRMLSKKK